VSATLWTGIIVPVFVAILATFVAAFWPSLQNRQRARRFHRIIARELQELGPNSTLPAGLPWWRYLTKRFVHEQIFSTPNLSANRDFLLSLDPDVLYGVSQLWTAFDKRDAVQWNYFLQYLSTNPKLKSEELNESVMLWTHVISESRHSRPPIPVAGVDPIMDWGGNLFDARVVRYGDLIEKLKVFNSESEEISPAERNRCAADLLDWYYKDGAGILLGPDAMAAWYRLRTELSKRTSTHKQLMDMASDFRTCLKIDLGVRHADERYVRFDA
jgi:hypothetical protein